MIILEELLRKVKIVGIGVTPLLDSWLFSDCECKVPYNLSFDAAVCPENVGFHKQARGKIKENTKKNSPLAATGVVVSVNALSDKSLSKENQLLAVLSVQYWKNILLMC